MQPEAGVVGPLLAIAFILGTAIFRSLSERSGQVPASTLTNSVANDPTATSAVADGPVLDASFERPPCRVGIETCSTAQRVRTSRAGRCHPVKTASYVVIDVDQDIV